MHLVTSYKPQASSNKLQAMQGSSFKLQAAQGASGKLQAPSSKHQAASHELQALQYFFLRKVSRC
jgi:hypothetical protein